VSLPSSSLLEIHNQKIRQFPLATSTISIKIISKATANLTPTRSNHKKSTKMLKLVKHDRKKQTDLQLTKQESEKSFVINFSAKKVENEKCENK
jgi:hypothetical protein